MATMTSDERKAAYRAMSDHAARAGRQARVDDACIHCGRISDEHVRLPTPDEMPRVHSRLYCDTARTHLFEAWWMRP